MSTPVEGMSISALLLCIADLKISPPVGLPTPFPPLTIEPNGDPDYSSQTPSTTTTSQSCTETETATQIMYYVFYDVDSSGSTTATSTYSTYSTVTEGCTVVGTTATSSETATCGTFQYDPDDPTTRPDDADNEDDPDFISAIPGAVASKLFIMLTISIKLG